MWLEGGNLRLGPRREATTDRQLSCFNNKESANLTCDSIADSTRPAPFTQERPRSYSSATWPTSSVRLLDLLSSNNQILVVLPSTVRCAS